MKVKKAGYVPDVVLVRGDTNPGGGTFPVFLPLTGD